MYLNKFIEYKFYNYNNKTYILNKKNKKMKKPVVAKKTTPVLKGPNDPNPIEFYSYIQEGKYIHF